jgi:hypothetical protein
MLPPKSSQSNTPTKIEPTPDRHQFDCSDDDWNYYLTFDTDNLNIVSWMKKVKQHTYDDIKLPIPIIGGLTNSILPVCGPQNWPLEDFETNPPPNLWDTLRLALQLASKMLMSKAAMSFLRTMKYGEEKDLPKGGLKYLNYEEPPGPITLALQEQAVVEDLNDMAAHVRFLFGAIEPGEEQAHVHAITCVSQELFGKRIFIRGHVSRLPSEDEKHIYVILNYAYRVCAEKPKHTACDYVRLLFSLAFTVTHELSHAYYAYLHPGLSEEWPEPAFGLDQTNAGEQGELGLALETALFGDLVKTTIHPERGVTIQWEPVSKQLVDTELVSIDGHLIFPLEPVWIYQLLTQGFWSAIAALDNKAALKALHLPKTNWGICVNTAPPHRESWGRRRCLPKANANLVAEPIRVDSAEESLEHTALLKGKKRNVNAKSGTSKKRHKASTSEAAPKLTPKATTVPWSVIEDYEEIDRKLLAEAVMKVIAKRALALTDDEVGDESKVEYRDMNMDEDGEEEGAAAN